MHDPFPKVLKSMLNLKVFENTVLGHYAFQSFPEPGNIPLAGVKAKQIPSLGFFLAGVEGLVKAIVGKGDFQIRCLITTEP